MARRAVIHPRLTVVCWANRMTPGYSRVIINEEQRRRTGAIKLSTLRRRTDLRPAGPAVIVNRRTLRNCSRERLVPPGRAAVFAAL